jgi:predicted  nucleic acid-binding Zn-ribbon protein
LPLSEEDRAEAIGRAREQVAGLRAQESELSGQVEAALKVANAAVATHRDAQIALDRWAGYDQRVKDLERDIRERGKAVEAAQAILDGTPEQDVAALGVALTTADVDMQAAQVALDQARSLEARREATATAQAVTAANTETELETAEQEWAMLEALVKRLEPAGLPAEAMKDMLGPVLDRVNAALTSFTDFELDCEPGADFKLLVERNGHTTPVAFLSTSEQYRIGVACQVAFALATGFGVVVVDGADILDGQSPMAAMLYRSGVQAIVACTVPRDKVKPGELPAVYPHGPGIASYWISGGTEERGTATLLGDTEQEREAA